LLDKPSKRRQEAIRTTLVAHQDVLRGTAQRYRLLLYATSLLLLGFLVHFGLKLRSRALALQRRAAYEHVIAGISTRLIDAQPREIENQIKRGLSELAELLHADRSYLVVSSNPAEINTWCRERMTFQLGWPERAPTLLARLGATGEGVVHIRSVDRLPSGAARSSASMRRNQRLQCAGCRQLLRSLATLHCRISEGPARQIVQPLAGVRRDGVGGRRCKRTAPCR